MKNRIISLLLTVMMVVDLQPMTVLANEACAHADVVQVYKNNEDGTHTITYAYKACSEAVANTADAVKMEFMTFVAAVQNSSGG